MAGINAGPSMGFRMPSFGIGQQTMQPFQNQNTLPTAQNPFLTYGTVQGGRVVPPTNPNAQPSNFPAAGGSWGNTPTPQPTPQPPNPTPQPTPQTPTPQPTAQDYMSRGGFTGGINVSPSFPTSYMDPNSANIPNVMEGSMNNAGGASSPTTSGIRNAYLGAGASLSNRPFRSGLFY